MQQNTGKTTQNPHSAIETDGKQMQPRRWFRRAAADFGSLTDIRSGMSQGHGFPRRNRYGAEKGRVKVQPNDGFLRFAKENAPFIAFICWQ